MTQDLALIVNPLSHTVRRKGSVLAKTGLTNAQMLELTDFSDLTRQIRTVAQKGARRICIEGGDGTVLAVLTACLDPHSGFDAPPEFAILPGGSTNLAHERIGLKARSIDAIQGRLSGPLGLYVQQPALRVETTALDVPLIGFLLSTGSLARAMRYVQREFHTDGRRGTLAILNAIIRFLAAPHAYQDTDGKPVLRESHLDMTIDQIRRQGPHLLTVMTTLPSLSLGLSPFWGKQTGQIALTHLGWPVTALRRSLVRALAGWHPEGLENRGFTSYRGNMISLTHTDTLMLDGEILNIPTDGQVHVTATEPLVFLR